MAEALTFGLVVTDKGTAVIKRFGKNIQAVGRNSEKAASRMIRAFTAFRGSLTGTIGAIFSLKGAIAGAGFGFLVKSVLEAGGAVESARLRLVGIRGSLEEATKAMKFFEQVASQVPFTLEKVIEAGVTLEAFGAKSEEALKPVADLAAFMGIEIPEAARAFGRAFAGGVGAADVLRERGVLTLVSLRTGIDDLTKLSLPEFRKALLTAMRDPTGPIADAAKRLASSWAGQISIMQDAIFQLQKTIAEAGLLEFAKETIGELTTGIRAFTASLEVEKMEKFGNVIVEIGPPIDSLLATMETGIRTFNLLAIVLKLLSAPVLLVAIGFTALTDAIGVTEGASERLAKFTKQLVKSTANNVAEIQRSVDRRQVQIEVLKNLTIARRGEIKALNDENAALGENNRLAAINTTNLDKISAGLTKGIDITQAFREAIAITFVQEFGDAIEQAGVDKVQKLTAAFADAIMMFRRFGDEGKQAVLEALDGIDPKNVEVRARAFIKAIEDVNKRTADIIAKNASTITSTLTAVSLGLRTSTVQDVAIFGESLNKRIQALKDAGATEAQLRRAQGEGALFITSTVFSQLGNIITQGGRKNLALAKAFAVGEAIVNTALAITRVLPNLPLAGLIGAIGAAQIATILSAKPGAGAPSVGGGGLGGGAFGGGAPAAPIEAAPTPNVPSVNITVQGFIGDEAQLQSELGRLVREAVGDDVDFGLETR